jgi:hypothetical protein
VCWAASVEVGRREGCDGGRGESATWHGDNVSGSAGEGCAVGSAATGCVVVVVVVVVGGGVVAAAAAAAVLATERDRRQSCIAAMRVGPWASKATRIATCGHHAGMQHVADSRSVMVEEEEVAVVVVAGGDAGPACEAQTTTFAVAAAEGSCFAADWSGVGSKAWSAPSHRS